ncbi:MAG: hypothetical protein ABJL86_00010 [Gilvibacter sp.]|uniref:hypothetical protein n=1 Tax=Reichenbachiella sp. TaxID=2184521 RepID=UPI003296CF94
MKMIKKISAIGLALLLVLQTTVFAIAPENKSVEKAKEAVENGSPDDWQLLAKQAKVLLRKKKDLGTAKDWIQKSIAINKDVSNLELMGDYYVLNNLPNQALDYYSQCSELMRQNDQSADISYYQNKIWQLKY